MSFEGLSWQGLSEHILVRKDMGSGGTVENKARLALYVGDCGHNCVGWCCREGRLLGWGRYCYKCFESRIEIPDGREGLRYEAGFD